MKIKNFKELCINYAQIFIVIVVCAIVILYEVYDRRVTIKNIDHLSTCTKSIDCGTNFVCSNLLCQCAETKFWVIPQ